MFDDFSKRSKAVRAAFDLAKERGWGDISLADIAQAANLSLADLRREFSCKTDIITRLPERGRRGSARQGAAGRRGANPARPTVRRHHDKVRGDAAL